MRYLYPGSFCPPTYGHLRILERASAVFGPVEVICSENPNKDNRWFTPRECKKLWMAYRLPAGTRVRTLSEVLSEREGRRGGITLIAGVRNKKDFECQARNAFENHERFGIGNFHYLFSEDVCAGISSSAARDSASNLRLEELPRYLAPLTVSAMLEKALGVQDIYLVVGKPGSGKSSFLKELSCVDSRNHIIKADDWNEDFKPLLRERFGSGDLVRLVIENREAVGELLGAAWFSRLTFALKEVPRGASIYVEAAYGLMEDKRLYRFLGGKVIQVTCGGRDVNLRRVLSRGTPEHVPFIDVIPGEGEARIIAQKEMLNLQVIDNSDGEKELKRLAREWDVKTKRKDG